MFLPPPFASALHRLSCVLSETCLRRTVPTQMDDLLRRKENSAKHYHSCHTVQQHKLWLVGKQVVAKYLVNFRLNKENSLKETNKANAVSGKL